MVFLIYIQWYGVINLWSVTHWKTHGTLAHALMWPTRWGREGRGGGKEGGREGRRKGGWEGGREGGKEGGKERGGRRVSLFYLASMLYRNILMGAKGVCVCLVLGNSNKGGNHPVNWSPIG